MSKVNTDYQKGFAAGHKAAMDTIRSNYDSWKRENMNRDVLTTSMGSLADLAVRQVIYSDPLGRPPHETEPKEKA